MKKKHRSITGSSIFGRRRSALHLQNFMAFFGGGRNSHLYLYKLRRRNDDGGH